ncbi:MAG: hypothetical protein M1818_002512 [Claussenomyces sp. TS43310]|nr:MAG: hypothetical protein M1818_002512 [Claussenomyces sp. TS43310]
MSAHPPPLQEVTDEDFICEAVRVIPWEEIQREIRALTSHELLSAATSCSLLHWMSYILPYLRAGQPLIPWQYVESRRILEMACDEIFGDLQQETGQSRTYNSDRIKAATLQFEDDEGGDRAELYQSGEVVQGPPVSAQMLPWSSGCRFFTGMANEVGEHGRRSIEDVNGTTQGDAQGLYPADIDRRVA